MRVAIIGYGVEGQAALRYFGERGEQLTVFDENAAVKKKMPAGVEFKHATTNFLANGFDIVVRSPAVRPDKIITDGTRTSVTQLFLENCPAPIIGVTGTKGKGTTASLIFEILKAAGKRVHLAGNIGRPAIDLLPDVSPRDIVVLELSSFQLWDVTISPQTAVVLMMEPDHMDVHRDMDEYITAKANIRRFQTLENVCLYHPKNALSRRIAETQSAQLAKSQQKHWQKQARRYGIPDDGQVYIKDETFFVGEHAICPVSELRLPGPHNRMNACAAMSAAICYTYNDAAIIEALRSFSGLEHRLEMVRELKGVTYINDSFSSAPGATIAAIRSFDAPEVLICGGYDRGLDFSELAEAIKTKQDIQVVAIGATAQAIANSLQAVEFKNIIVLQTPNLQTIVKTARQHAAPGSVVLFSPGCPSFDMFANFSERGHAFKKIVQELQA